MKTKMMYVIDTDRPYNSEFLKSAWAGEGYATRKEANEHLKFFKSRGLFVNEKLSIKKEEAPAGW